MIKIFENLYGANTEGIRQSLGLGIDANKDVTIVARNANVEIAGQSKSDVDLKLTGLADVTYSLTEDGNGELIIRVTGDNSADVRPTLRVYLPFKDGIENLQIMTNEGNVTMNSVVNRAFIAKANITAIGGDVALCGKNIIRSANIMVGINHEVGIDYEKIQSQLSIVASGETVWLSRLICDEYEGLDTFIDIVSPNGHNIHVERYEIE